MDVTGNSAKAYTPQTIARVKSTCLTLAQALGDDLLAETVIVGGLVPTLLYESATPMTDVGAHVGTLDVDLALDLVILETERYEDMAERLDRAEFAPDEKASGVKTRQRWRSPDGVSIDFLMPPVPPDEAGKRIQSITPDLAASTMRGLDLALAHAIRIPLAGTDLKGRNVTREIPVCPAHLFVMLKALAMRHRDKHKDAYDLYFVLATDDRKPEGLGAALAAFATHSAVAEAIATIERDFDSVDGRAAVDVCTFLGRPGDDALAGDVLAFGRAFLAGYRSVVPVTMPG